MSVAVDVGSAVGQVAATHSYHVVHGWPRLPPNEMLDEVSAVAVDSHEHVFILTRAGRKWPDTGPLDTTAIGAPTVLVFDGNSGRLIAKWGSASFALPHSITVDQQDNVWITDVAWHQAFKFTHDGPHPGVRTGRISHSATAQYLLFAAGCQSRA